MSRTPYKDDNKSISQSTTTKVVPSWVSANGGESTLPSKSLTYKDIHCRKQDSSTYKLLLED